MGSEVAPGSGPRTGIQDQGLHSPRKNLPALCWPMQCLSECHPRRRAASLAAGTTIFVAHHCDGNWGLHSVYGPCTLSRTGGSSCDCRAGSLAAGTTFFVAHHCDCNWGLHSVHGPCTLSRTDSRSCDSAWVLTARRGSAPAVALRRAGSSAPIGRREPPAHRPARNAATTSAAHSTAALSRRARSCRQSGRLPLETKKGSHGGGLSPPRAVSPAATPGE